MHVDAESPPIDSQARTLINSINAGMSLDDVDLLSLDPRIPVHLVAPSHL
jgi:hypothetical protein